MTAPVPHGPAPRPNPPSGRAARLGALARKWAYALNTTAYLPHTPAEIERELGVLAGNLFAAAAAEPPDLDAAAAAGARLVELRCVGPESLRRSTEVLGKALIHEPGAEAERVVLVLGALSTGYAEAQRDDIQRRQEDLGRALVKVEQETRRKHVLARGRFEAVFAGSATGVALTEPGGRVLRANAALAKIVNRTPAEIAALSLFDLVHPEDVQVVRDGFADLLEGRAEHVRLSKRLVGKDGEPMWASIAATAVPDLDGVSRQVVTLIDDDTEVALLQRRLSHQALHDALTGLPNRQFFSTRLENLLAEADPATGVTLYHLDIDGFSGLTGGLGAAAGDRLLRQVAAKLKALTEDEDALVARLGADEFGVLVKNTERTPDVTTFVRQLIQDLAEPVYVEDTTGVGAVVSVGVVHRPPRDSTPAELLRASDLTLRRARRAGNQWELFDRDLDRRDRHEFALAAAMAGAWENGEIEVVHRPLVRLAGEDHAGVEARLRWRHPREGVLEHEDCVRLARMSGLALPLGTWLLRTAAERLPADGLPLTVGLTAQQAGDPELVGVIRRVLDETGVAPDRLRPGFPAAALLAESGDAAENFGVLAEIGVPPEIHDFGAAADVTCLADLPARTVRLSRRLTKRRDHPLVARCLGTLVEVAHRAGAAVVVEDVATLEQAEAWQADGVDLAAGPRYR